MAKIQEPVGKKETIKVRDTDYQYIEEGVDVNGEIVDWVLARGESFAIYQVKNRHQFSYGLNPSAYSTETIQIYSQLENLYSDAREKIKWSYDRRLQIKYANLLAYLLTNNNLEQRYIDEFKDFIDMLRPVRQLIGSTDEFIVWICEDGEVAFHAVDAVKSRSKGVVEFTRLKSLAAVKLKDSELQKFHGRLGSALVRTFESRSDIALDIFGIEEEYLKSLVTNRIRINFLIVVSLVTITFSTFAYCAYHFHTGVELPRTLLTSLIPVCAGFLGAYISLFERFRTVEISDNDTLELIVTQAVFRVLLGGLFGFIAYVAALSNLAFGVFNSSHPSLFILGLIGGFSERLIPNLLESFANPSDVKSKS